MLSHELYMRRCLDLALLGKGTVSPNPLVGALIVHDGKILAENYHQQYGGPHAEVLVIRDVINKFGAETASLLQNATLYVTLEPCSHFGKTPPCADLILEHRIPRVVCAMKDPSDKVNGKGLARLREHGVEVVEGVLEQEAQWINRRFTTQIQKHRPYIILKFAQTKDGFMAPDTLQKKWITGKASDQLVHRWRSEEDAILVGSGTAIADNPKLDVRTWEGRNPKRILIDRQLSVPTSHAIYDDRAETIVFNEVKTEWGNGVKWIALENYGMYLPQQIAYQLYLMDVQSLVVEGGIQVLDLFIQSNLWDEAQIFTSSTKWGSGRPTPQIEGEVIQTFRIGNDQLSQIINKK